jgi:hypothetical protein
MGKPINQIIKEHFVKDFRTGTPFDDTDTPERFPLPGKWDGREFSLCNADALCGHLFKAGPKTIVEIGVARLETSKYENTSTNVFLRHKDKHCIYIGIDIEDRSFIRRYAPNTHTLKMDSTDTTAVFAELKKLGVTQIDFLFIDGWHSINNVIREFEYADLLSDDGVIGLHDTNLHPGPRLAVENINREKWNVHQYCPDDWGITFLTRVK